MSAEQVYFMGTKYETRVDVGRCFGRCRLKGKLFLGYAGSNSIIVDLNNSLPQQALLGV